MDQHRKGTERPLHARLGNAAAREWPKRKTTVTPYCFRHQLAADMKADGRLDSGEISAALDQPERCDEIDIWPREHVQGAGRSAGPSDSGAPSQSLQYFQNKD